jgi:hypothetical protein
MPRSKNFDNLLRFFNLINDQVTHHKQVSKAATGDEISPLAVAFRLM